MQEKIHPLEEVAYKFFGNYFRNMKERYVNEIPLKIIDDVSQLKEGGTYVDLGDPSSGWGPMAFTLLKILKIDDKEIDITIKALEDHEDSFLLEGDEITYSLPVPDIGFIYDATSIDNVVPHEPNYEDSERKLIVALRHIIREKMLPEEVVGHFSQGCDGVNDIANQLKFELVNVHCNPGMYFDEHHVSSNVKINLHLIPALRDLISSARLSKLDSEAIRVYLDGEVC